MQTKDIYLAATAMCLGLKLLGGDRKNEDGPVYFMFRGPQEVWDKLQSAWLNNEPITLRPATFSAHIRALKTLVHERT